MNLTTSYRALFVALYALILSACILSPTFAQKQPTTPEASVTYFYTWFIERDAQDRGYPLMNPEIYRYVSKGTVDRLRTLYKQNGFAERAEYFTRVQDFDERDWLSHVATRPAIMMGDAAVVPVTLGSFNPQHLVVFLRKQGGIWKITKVDDTRDAP
jgi:hypothetical protein